MARGALGRDPVLSSDAPRVVKGRGTKGGALSQDPPKTGYQAAGTVEGIDAQIARMQAVVDKKGVGNAPKAQKRLEMLNAARGKLGGNTITTPGGPSIAGPDFASVTGQGNEALASTFEQMQNQGAFNPGDYSQMRQQAENSVMDSFNRRMEPQFQQQEQRFKQQMANQGIPENSEMYNQQYQQLQQGQNDARQSAMGQAFQLGQSEQAQGWGQQFQGYQLPMQQLQALSPYYGTQAQMQMQQGQQDFAAEQGQLDRDFNKWQTKYGRTTAWNAPRSGGGGGGGAMSMADRMALMQAEQQGQLFNGIVMSGLQNGEQPNIGGFGQGFAGGFAGGSGATLGSNLRG